MKMSLQMRYRYCYSCETPLQNKDRLVVPDNEAYAWYLDSHHVTSVITRTKPFSFPAVTLLLSWVTLSTFAVDFAVGKLFSTQMSQRVVTTRQGRLRGILITLPDPELPSVEAYLGLEYASLLDGDLRFMPPTMPSAAPWDGIRNALKFKPVCPQPIPDVDAMAVDGTTPPELIEHLRRVVPFLERQQEDCLYLNIYVPANRDCCISAADKCIPLTGVGVTRTIPDRNSSILLPVVLFVHGESYEVGTGNAYDGSVMAAFGRVIVVTFNYRLGVLGFLTTNDVHAPGNYALLDQVAALRWIADNIGAFGGNSSSVTLFGDRVGGAMVGLLMASPITRGRNLFHQAIVHSGSVLSSWAVSDDAVRCSRTLAELLNCTSRDAQVSSSQHHPMPGSPDNANMVRCLRRFSSDRLANIDVVRDDAQVNGRPAVVPWYSASFGPTLGGAAASRIVSSSTAMMEDLCGNNQDTEPSTVRWTKDNIPLLLGVVGNEGYAYVNHARHHSNLRDDEADKNDVETVDETNWRRELRVFVRANWRYHQQKILDVLSHNYNDWENEYQQPQPSNDEREISETETISVQSVTSSRLSFRHSRHQLSRQRVDDLAELIGDGQYGAPTIRLARLHSTCGRRTSSDDEAGSITYLYAFDGHLPTTSFKDGSNGADRISSGGGYKRDLAYAFGAPLADGIDPFATNHAYADTDRMLARTVLIYWTNFIRTGNPNTSPSDRLQTPAVEWTQFDPDNQAYLSIGTHTSVQYHYKNHKMALWNDLLPRLHRPDKINSQLHQLDINVNDDVIVRSHHTEATGSTSYNWTVSPSPRPTTSSIGSRMSLHSHVTDILHQRHRRPTSTTMIARPISGFGFFHHVTISPSELFDDEPPETVHADDMSAPAVTNQHPGMLATISGQSTFGLTMVVGFMLLTLNAIVFAATFCQWRNLVHRRRKYSPSAIQSRLTKYSPSAIQSRLTKYSPSAIQSRLTKYSPSAIQSRLTMYSPSAIQSRLTMYSPSAIQSRLTKYSPSAIQSRLTMYSPSAIQSRLTKYSPSAIQSRLTMYSPSAIQSRLTIAAFDDETPMSLRSTGVTSCENENEDRRLTTDTSNGGNAFRLLSCERVTPGLGDYSVCTTGNKSSDGSMTSPLMTPINMKHHSQTLTKIPVERKSSSDVVVPLSELRNGSAKIGNDVTPKRSSTIV